MNMNELAVLKWRLEHAIAVWDKRNKNHHAGAIALQRLDDVMKEIKAGKSIHKALFDGFNDRLLVALEKAASLPHSLKDTLNERVPE